MGLAELSESAQNYLKVIWGLQEWSDAAVTPTLIAERAGVRLSTASGAVGKLADQGLVEHAPYGAVTLTRQGHRYALEMVRRHRLIETFLVQVLGYRWDQVHDEAERLEHAVSDFMVERLDAHLGRPTRDPHGDPIPDADGHVPTPAARLLADVEPGHTVRVERISDADPELLRYFAEHHITVGVQLEVQPGPPYSESLHIRPAGGAAPLSLGGAATRSVWVSAAEEGPAPSSQ